jgi:Ca2+-binding RTX toxin-like protein
VRRVVFVVASGVAFVVALGVAFLDLNGGLAQAAQPGGCPPPSTYEQGYGCVNTVEGTSRKDNLYGSRNPRIKDRMYGYENVDRLYSYSGSDGISGGDGSDYIRGGEGDDGLFGDAGNDRIHGESGNDQIFADDRERDAIYGESGNDDIFAQDAERDIISCGPGDDVAYVDTLDAAEADCELLRPYPPPPGGSFWGQFMKGGKKHRSRQFAGRLNDYRAPIGTERRSGSTKRTAP